MATPLRTSNSPPNLFFSVYPCQSVLTRCALSLSVLAEAIETWEPLKRLRTLVAEGRLRLSPEDEKGLLGQAILRRHDGLQGARETGPSTQKTGSSGDGPAETGGSQRAQAGMPFSDLVFDPGDELPFSALPPEEPLFQLAAEVGAEELLQVPGLRTWIEETRGEAPPQKKLNTQMESTDGSDSPSMSGASANSPSYVSTTTSRSPDTDFGPLSDEQFLQLLSDVESKEDDIQTLDVLWQLPDLGYDIGSSWGPASTPAVFAPETPAAPPPQPAQFSDVVASSSPDEGAALRDTNTVHAGRGGSQAGPLAGEEWYRQEMGELQGFRLDSEVPSPQNAREPLDHLLGVSAAPGTSVPHPPSAQQSASGGVATGVLPDEALFAEGMASLRALGLTERSPDAESLLKQTELLRELTASTGARPLSVSGASSRYGSLQVARLRSIRREAAIQLEEAFSAAVAAAHQSGTVYENTRELWSRFRARLRELTTLTLLVVNQLQK
ncbi:hypothetical protein CSUI_005334 [Cystoisospora suis]|uniref:Uncharacterized protein n=1 Tax=Cystoisospora suis TaxID=483139 RepID=A0A2C6KXY8_9APIC|nr:hypothetical protein CSUI_005334 [Cystoisospora suis]